MVGQVTSFACDKCRREFFTYAEARDCELDHVIDAAVERITKKIKDALRKEGQP